MVAYTKPQQRKKEESERLRGERGQIKFIVTISNATFNYLRLGTSSIVLVDLFTQGN